ncbi:arsenic transporter [Candidatus Heimdallarchaeota archaeon B3_Heim]|nr:MAG: arsenic transporter [Candidatus Heimdallarchaeota archaeon B3_Heim]
MSNTYSTYTEFFDQKKDIRTLIFAGKGGLGKTTLSAATSIHFSNERITKTLVFSTDPQASLSDVFEKDVFGKGEIKLADNLYVTEIDADREIELYTQSVRQKIFDLYQLEEIPEEIEEYIESAKAEPAMHESATYDAMVSLVSRGDYKLYIFDMPPFGHGVRFVSTADVLDNWIHKITDMREKSEEYEEVAAKFTGKTKQDLAEDAIMGELTEIRDRLTFFSSMLKNEDQTGFFMILVPEKMAILDTERAITMFEQFGISISGIIVNQVYPPELLEDEDLSDFLKHKIEMQQTHLETIYKRFGDRVLAVIPMYDREPKGIELLSKVAKDLFMWEKPD